MNHAVLAPPGSDVRAELDRLLRTDPAVADRDEIAELVSTVTSCEPGSTRTKCVVPVALANSSLPGDPSRSGRCSLTCRATLRQGRRQGRRPQHACATTRCVRRRTGTDGSRRDTSTVSPPRSAISTMSPGTSSLRRHPTARRCGQRGCRHVQSALSGVVPASGGVAGDVGRGGTRSATGASNVKRWVDKVTGMCHTHAELDPIRDAALCERHRCRTRPAAS